MDFVQAIVLGIVQGLTEFIPVSSSGHLELIPRLFSWESPSTAFVTFLHIGTSFALIFYYRKLILRYIQILYKYIRRTKDLKSHEKADMKTIFNIIIASIPAVIIGVVLEKFISGFYDNPENNYISGITTASAMIVIGVLFLFANRIFSQKKFSLEKLSHRKALIIGITQTFAFFRGVSRSGITLLAGQALGLKRVDAAEFGFLMSIPIMIGTTIYSIYKLLQIENYQNEIPFYLVGGLASFIFGLIAINFMLKYLKNNGLQNFGIYRIVFGIFIIILIMT